MKVGKSETHYIERQWVEEIAHGRWSVVVDEVPEDRQPTSIDWLATVGAPGSGEALTSDSPASHEIEGYPYDDSPAD